MAGCLFQLERALVHLADPKIDAVAVEHVDDVATFKDDQLVAQEQDKHTVRPKGDILGDRSIALWRTLQIWVGQRRAAETCGRYLIALNSQASAPLALMIKGLAAQTTTPAQIVSALRAAGNPPRRRRSVSNLQKCIDDVLSENDAELEVLVAAIEIVDSKDASDWRSAVVGGLAIDPTVSQEAVLTGLFGWLSDTLLSAWRSGIPGIVSRKACIRQCRALEQSLVRQRLLPRPASQVPVTPEERARAMGRRFVDHLSRIDATRDDVVEAVDHFVRFNTEKYRMAGEGGISANEWRYRGERLQQRWRNIARRAQIEKAGETPQRIGLEILMEATYDYHEPIDGMTPAELYMTSGHYHRLADVDGVWWDPTFVPDPGDTDGS